MNERELFGEYEVRYNKYLTHLADKLSDHLIDNLAQTPRIDRVSARAKSPVRFMNKALKTENGIRKYDDPLNQIQDQVGARVVTFYLEDVDRISAIIDDYYRPIESKILIPESESEFGYIGKHYILIIPEDVFGDDAPREGLPKFFELQIKTLFQHAWSEANHDLGYKPDEAPTPLQKRQMAFTAAQAWGADQVFSKLFKELSG